MATGAISETDLTGDTRTATKPLKYIQFEIADCIARLTMSHAPHNVLIVPMMKEMAEAIEPQRAHGRKSDSFTVVAAGILSRYLTGRFAA